MISLEDVLDLCPLTRDEIAAIAEHEHIDGIAAVGLADYLMHLPKGPQAVQVMICDDIRAALHRDDLTHARALFATLRHFMADHPDAARGAPG
jgi:hypothetical protein